MAPSTPAARPAVQQAADGKTTPALTAAATTEGAHPWPSVVADLWSHIRPVNRAQHTLAWTGLLLVVLGLAHLPVFLVDAAQGGASWSGPVSWRKPVVFGLSLGILLLTMLPVLRPLPGRRRQWAVVAPLTLGSVVEYLAITSQRWRGVPSHFNDHTPYDTAVFGVMAVAVALIVLAVAGLLVWCAVPRRRAGFRGSAALRLAVVVGLVAVLVSSWVGGRMIAEGQAVLEATGQVPDQVVLGAAGSAKLFHAVGQHGVQVLLGLALLLEVTGTARRRALGLVGVAAIGYAGVLAGVGAAALRGEGYLALPASLLLPAVPGALLLTAAALLAFGEVRRWVSGPVPAVVGWAGGPHAEPQPAAS